MFTKLGKAFTKRRGNADLDRPRSARPAVMATLRDGRSKNASELACGDVVVVAVGEVIPGDGIVIEGVALVDESAITGESAPVVRESGTDRCVVISGTRVLSDRIVVEITGDTVQR